RTAAAISARRSASATRSGSPIAAASSAAAWAMVSAGTASVSDDDIDASLALHHLVALESHFRIGRALAGLQIVFPAVPRTNDMRLVFVVGLAEELAVRPEQIDDLVADDALAGGPTLVQAVIAVGVERAGVPVDADLMAVLAHDADLAVLHLELIANEHLCH